MLLELPREASGEQEEDEEEEEEEETVWVFLVPRVSQKTVLGSRVNIGPH